MPQGRGELVHLRLVGEARLHRAEAAHRAARRVVRPNRIAVHLRVRDLVRAGGEAARVGDDRGARRRVGPAVEDHPALDVDQRAVPRRVVPIPELRRVPVDLSMQVHACLLALHTGRPVKIVYNREESFFGHVHRHPCKHALRARRRPATASSSTCEARILLDGGAYASSSTAVVANAACFAAGPYAVPNATHRRLRRLHEQPAVRRHARLRRRADVLRARGADGQARRGAAAWTRSSCGSATRWRPATACSTGQVDHRPAPVAELLERLRAMPLPPSRDGDARPARPARRRVEHDRTARASCAASATRSASRTSASPRASTTTRPPASG